MRLLFIVDPLDRLALAGDTSYALMLEAATRGWEIWTCQLEHLGLEGDEAIADAVPTLVAAAEMPGEAFQVGARATGRLSAFDMVLMRKDPPLDVSYLHATWILDHAHGKTLLVNEPRGLRELNEHLAVLRFPNLTPPTIVTRSAERLRAFFRGLPVRVAFIGGQAILVDASDVPVAIECETGLTDAFIAHQPLAMRGHGGRIAQRQRGLEIGLDHIFRRRQDVGHEVVAELDLVIQRPTHLEVLQGPDAGSDDGAEPQQGCGPEHDHGAGNGQTKWHGSLPKGQQGRHGRTDLQNHRQHLVAPAAADSRTGNLRAGLLKKAADWHPPIP